jgi:hypothetical protein
MEVLEKAPRLASPLPPIPANTLATSPTRGSAISAARARK